MRQKDTTMALIAMTTADVTRYCSDRDPAKLRKIVPVDPDVPDGPKKVDITYGPDATWFELRPLDVFQMGFIYDNASSLTGQSGGSEIGIKTRMNQTNLECVRYGLVKVENFHSSKAEGADPVKFKHIKSVIAQRQYDAVPDTILNMLGNSLCAELADEIKRISEVSAAEAKNSDAA